MPPRLARLLAVIAALAMVGGAVYVVTRDSGKGKGSDGPDPTGSTGDGSVKVACVTELEAVCNAVAAKHPEIGLTVEDAGTTEATLTQPGTAPFAAWITLDPWPAMVDAERDQGTRPPFFPAKPAAAVASTPLAAVMPADRYSALTKACGRSRTSWDCVSRFAGQDWPSIAPTTPAAQGWGTFKVGVGDPDTALGALFVGQNASAIASANRLGTDYGANDFTAAMRQQLRAPIQSSDRKDTADQLTDIVIQRGSYSLVASLAPPATTTVSRPQALAQGLQAVQIGPAARADAVVAPLTTDAGRASQIREWFTDKTAETAFAEMGWAFGPPKGSNGMPDADVLAALRQEIA